MKLPILAFAIIIFAVAVNMGVCNANPAPLTEGLAANYDRGTNYAKCTKGQKRECRDRGYRRCKMMCPVMCFPYCRN